MLKFHCSRNLFLVLGVIALTAIQAARADVVFNSDFSKGDFDTLGWKTKGAFWQIYDYGATKSELKNSPGLVARFAPPSDFKGVEYLIKTFPAAVKPTDLTLTFDGGWGWGSASQGSDAFSVMLLDDQGNGYEFSVHRTNAKWAAQWAPVAYWVPGKANWSPAEIDATQPAVIDGGGLQTFTIKRDHEGAWTFSGDKWTGGTPFAFSEPTVTTSTFSQVVLVGSPNFDSIVFNKIHLDITSASDPDAIPKL